MEKHKPAELRNWTTTLRSKVCVCICARGCLSEGAIYLKQDREPLNEGISQNKNTGLVLDTDFGKDRKREMGQKIQRKREREGDRSGSKEIMRMLH